MKDLTSNKVEKAQEIHVFNPQSGEYESVKSSWLRKDGKGIILSSEGQKKEEGRDNEEL
jgi:hypothetical protein